MKLVDYWEMLVFVVVVTKDPTNHQAVFYRGNPRNPRSSYDRGNFGCWFGDFVGDLRRILRKYVLETLNHILRAIWALQVVTGIHDSAINSQRKCSIRKTLSIVSSSIIFLVFFVAKQRLNVCQPI